MKPVWIIDDDRSLQCGILEMRAVVRNLVRDSIHDDRIRAGTIHASPAELGVFRSYAGASGIDLFDKGGGPRPFAAYDDADA